MNRRLTWLSLTLLVLGAVGLPTIGQLAGCGEVGTLDERYINYQLFVPSSGETGEQTARNRLIDDIDDAGESVRLAVTYLDDDGVVDALIAARDRGVDVRVVADSEFRDVEGMDALEEARISPAYGDGELVYLPDFFLSQVLQACQPDAAERVIVCSSGQTDEQGYMVRPDEFNLMSDNMFVIDEYVTWNFTLPLDGRETHPIAWRATGSVLSKGHAREINQMYGGTFATTLDTYSAPLKSINDMHLEYHSSTGPIEIGFNPQERLIKEIIDEVYRAKSSVWVMSNNIMNPFLLDALEYKDANGFDVQITVNGAAQADGSPTQRLQALDADFKSMPDQTLPTVILLNAESDDVGRMALVLSHSLVRGAPYEVERRAPNDFVYIYESDQFFDGNMWVLTEYGQSIGQRPEIDQLIDYWEQVKQQ